MIVHQALGSILFWEFLQDVLVSDLAKSMGSDIASSLAMVDELKFSEPLALRLASLMVYQAMWILLEMCLKGIRISAWMKVTSVAYCPTGLATIF